MSLSQINKDSTIQQLRLILASYNFKNYDEVMSAIKIRIEITEELNKRDLYKNKEMKK